MARTNVKWDLYARVIKSPLSGNNCVQLLSGYSDWGEAGFTPDEARDLADALYKLADEAECDPKVAELTRDLEAIVAISPYSWEDFAKKLVAKGYHR